MRLRGNIVVPTRFEDDDVPNSHSRNGTKPHHPDFLKAQVIPFSPTNPPAAFPSLPFATKRCDKICQLRRRPYVRQYLLTGGRSIVS